ncbi:hypothetical protein NDU88_007390 [Pleurodeles waltl]|uniref:Uncharacterized protein n=1 Tax=Pleurodeles waltl TaxID=8319 RepID=A0AAV7VTJ6_PLEWA|nr:hypothetical protein NDU88_007390 [Pleurodeles waltl]
MEGPVTPQEKRPEEAERRWRHAMKSKSTAKEWHDKLNLRIVGPWLSGREAEAGIRVAALVADTETISGSPHPLVAAINQLETEEIVLGAEGGVLTLVATQ